MKTVFGWIDVRGRTYDHDGIIHTDGSVSRRKKKASKAMKEDHGHTLLSGHEPGVLADERPGLVYIGTGQYGSLPITPGAEEVLAAYMTIVRPTGEILASLAREERSFVAILHVTC